MTKNMYIALFFLFLLFTGCGFFIWSIQQDEAQKDVEIFLIQNRLQNAVSYEKAILSLSDSSAVKGLRIKNDSFFPFDNRADFVTVRSLRKRGGAITELDAEATGVSFEPLKAAEGYVGSPEELVRNLTDFSPVKDAFFRPFEAMSLAGCDTVKADVFVRMTYAPAAKTMRATLNLKDACLGEASLAVSFGDITAAKQQKLISALKNIVAGKPFKMYLADFFKNTTVSDIDFTFREARLVTGYKRYLDTLYLRLPDSARGGETDTYRIQTLSSYLSFFSIHKQKNLETARTLAKFFKNPRFLRLTTKTGRQVPLNNLKGDMHRRILELLLKADATVFCD